jgi:hypothetical protein
VDSIRIQVALMRRPRLPCVALLAGRHPCSLSFSLALSTLALSEKEDVR